MSNWRDARTLCPYDGCDIELKPFDIERHFKLHEKSPPRYKCPVNGCPTECSTKGSLKLHQELHDRNPNFIINGCAHTEMNETKRNVHENLAHRSFPCRVRGCTVVLTTEDKRTLHEVGAHVGVGDGEGNTDWEFVIEEV